MRNVHKTFLESALKKLIRYFILYQTVLKNLLGYPNTSCHSIKEAKPLGIMDFLSPVKRSIRIFRHFWHPVKAYSDDAKANRCYTSMVSKDLLR